MKIDKQGQKTVAAKMQQSQESVVINPDQTILIDGQKADCSQKACQTKQGGATVTKVQTSDGKCQIHLTTKVRISLAHCSVPKLATVFFFRLKEQYLTGECR